jgi:hypothetical protein
VGLAWTGRGEAKPVAGIELHWVAPARCPGPDDVRARMRWVLGRDAGARPSSARLVAEGTVVEVSGHYRLTLKVTLEAEPAAVTRVFESTSCESLAGAAAVTLALLARGEAPSDTSVSPPAPGTSPGPSSVPPSGTPPASSSASATGSSSASAPASSSVSSPEPRSSPASAESSALPSKAPPSADAQPAARETAPTPGAATVSDPERTATARGGLVLQVPVLVSDAGVLPSPAYGLGAGVGVHVRRLQVMLSGILWLSHYDAGATPYAATYQRRTGDLSGCYSWRYGPFEGGPCLMVTLEDVTADSSGADVMDRQGRVSWLTVGLGARAGWSLAAWEVLFLRPTVSFTTSRPTFAIDGFGALYKVPLTAVGVELGSEWIF